MTQHKLSESDQEYLEAVNTDMIAREAKLAAREKAVAEREAALLSAPPAAAPLVSLSETDLDLSTASSEAQQGRGPNATPGERKAYGKWLRENHPGHAPQKTFHVTLKKRNTEDRTFTLQAVDEADARRQAYQQAGIAQRTEGFNAIVERI